MSSHPPGTTYFNSLWECFIFKVARSEAKTKKYIDERRAPLCHREEHSDVAISKKLWRFHHHSLPPHSNRFHPIILSIVYQFSIVIKYKRPPLAQTLQRNPNHILRRLIPWVDPIELQMGSIRRKLHIIKLKTTPVRSLGLC